MKKTNSIIIIAWTSLLMLYFNSCKEVVPVDHQNAVITLKPQSLSISKNEVSFNTSDASTSTIKINSTNVEWEITGIPDWMTIKPTSGSGDETVTVSVSENRLTSNRVGILSLKSTDDSWCYRKTITVSQYRAQIYAIPEINRIEFDGSSSNFILNVTSNTEDWRITKNASSTWCTVTKGDGKINISTVPNTDNISRECQFAITTVDGTEYVTIVQRPANISTTIGRLDYKVAGGFLSVPITSEAPWIGLSSYSWINIYPESGESGDDVISVEVTANNSLTARRGYIYLVLSDNNKIEIPVFQDGIDFSIDNTLIDAPVTGNDFQISIQSNTSWKLLDSIPSWLTLSPKTGTGDGKISIKVAANSSYNDRLTSFKIAPTGLTNAATEVVVKQSGHTFDTDSTALHFSDKASSSYFNIISDGSWTVVPSSSWITLDKENGSGNSKISVSVSENKADSIRLGYILASIEGKQAKISVYQQGKYLNISSNALYYASKGGSTQVSLKTNNSWTASASNDWIILSNKEGSYDCILTITTSDNPSATGRNGYVDITPKELNPIRINVNQSARYLMVSVDTIQFFYKGGTFDPVIIETDGVVDVSTDVDWFTLNKESNNQFTVTTTQNDNDNNRFGNVTISLTDISNGTVAKTIVVTQKNRYNGYDYVDLGLSVLWATCNVGATTPESYGDYYSWGEVSTKSYYMWENYKYRISGESYDNVKFSKYNTRSSYGVVDNKSTLELEDDVASLKWGGIWRIPSKSEQVELIKNCTWVWTTVNGINGYIVTSNVPGYTDRSIFLPAAGYHGGTNIIDLGTVGYYRSNSLYLENPYDACYLLLNSNRVSADTYRSYRFNGFSVRPVSSSDAWLKNVSISLNSESENIVQTDTCTLRAIVKHGSDIIDRDVAWSSNDTSIATVSETGLVTGIGVGTTNITAKCLGKTATCTITVKELAYEYVDLGLSVNWATFNVGAKKTEEFGDYYAWGDVETYYEDGYAQENPMQHWKSGKTNGYTLDSYKHYDSDNKKYFKYNINSSQGTVDNKTVLDPEDDVAHVKWGGNWRMPTLAELNELIDNCTCVETRQNGIRGILVTSKIKGYESNSIFLPCVDSNRRGYYWLSSLYTTSQAYVIELDDESKDEKLYLDAWHNYRSDGNVVRPVCPSETWLSGLSISLNKSSQSISLGNSSSLTATVKNGNQKMDWADITWSSDDSSVAIVRAGVVSSVAVGSTTITASCLGKKATCTITITSPKTEHEYVDLGLSVMWATCNVGAEELEDYGNYYAWGETEINTNNYWSSYKWCNGTSTTLKKYNTRNDLGTIDNKTVLDIEDDVSHVRWGGDWRMPTKAEQEELLNNCTWTWYSSGNSEFGGIAGYKVTSNKSGYTDRFIFLPSGIYWTSSVYTGFPSQAYMLSLSSSSNNYYMSQGARCSCHTVRSVFESEDWHSGITITINSDSLSIVPGNIGSLSATVKHDSDVIDWASVTWSTGDSSIATVSETGLVTGIAEGMTTITATSMGKTAICTINIIPQLSEYEYVDLGLSVNWATFNVGANKPEDFGDYYAWGETEPYYEVGYAREDPQTHWKSGKSDGYIWTNYKFFVEKKYYSSDDETYVIVNKYGTVDNKATLDLEDDVAHVKWGGTWRMPTFAEQKELLNNCTCVATKLNGVDGFLVTSNMPGFEGRSIFLPKAGFRSGTNLYKSGRWDGDDWYSGYWSSSVSTSLKWQYVAGGLFMIDRGESEVYSFDEDDMVRSCGLSVRPVCPTEMWLNNVSVVLNSENQPIVIGQTNTLIATVKHGSDVLNNSITWTSSNPSVATVTENGLVTGKSVGSTTITAECMGKTATCVVTVTAPEPEYVDLGLSVKWATFNLGAYSPEDYGDYYSWAETETKDDYSWESYKWSLGYYPSFTKYNNDNSFGSILDNNKEIDEDDDVAHLKWGGNWYMPTNAQIDELINNCTRKWTTQNGVYGYKITGKNGNSIFLPAAGLQQESGPYAVTTDGHYWGTNLAQYPNAGFALSFDNNHFNRAGANRYYGFNIRPVYLPESYLDLLSINLNKVSQSIIVEKTYNLTATVKYGNTALVKEVAWSSSDPTIATVSETGEVTGIAVGTANITASCYGVTSTCVVTIVEPTPEYVDLGLSVNWATFNVGASAPEEYGKYYAWGEVATKDNYQWSTYKWGSTSSFTKYNYSNENGSVDNKMILDLEDDVAHALWGGNWRMPKNEEFVELYNNCTKTWTTMNGVSGYKFTSKIDGYTSRFIFLPASGFYSGSNKAYIGTDGYYWSSSLHTSEPYSGYVMYFSSNSVSAGASDRRFGGFSVRPVIPSETWLDNLSITLNKEYLDIQVGETNSLIALVQHINNYVSDKKVVWSSNKPSVADVSEDGIVTAFQSGSATITATYNGKSTSCNVTVLMPEYVDLGLSVKWATCNLGASSPEGYGDYYAWGEIVTRNQTDISNINNYNYSGNYVRSYYTWATYKWGDGTPSGSDVIKYSSTDGKKTLELGDDVANHIKGGKWRMPTYTEMSELLENCTWTWTTYNDINGYKVKSNVNNNSIFLPAAGAYYNSFLDAPSTTGNYWSSTVDLTSRLYAKIIHFRSNSPNASDYSLRDVGSSIRPVYDENMVVHEYVDLGLSVKWATCNVGASSPEEYGSYYAWGETVTKTSYDWSNYSYRISGDSESNVKLNKYNTNNSLGIVDNKTILEIDDDVAHALWGGSWRIPTKADQDDLRNKCTWKWYSNGNTEFNGVAGYKVTSNIEGYTDHFIFLPAAGYHDDTVIINFGLAGNYWSSTLYGSQGNARCLYFYSGSVSWGYRGRSYGLSVRPVCP